MSKRNKQEPVEKREDRWSSFSHPAFGQIGASRVTGGATLYASDFVHQHFVSIVIRRSQLNRDLSHDWHFGREELIEVRLSEAQWATFVSSMNVGMGTPCTIAHVAGEAMPDIPLRRQESVVQQELAATLSAVESDINATIADIEGILGTSVSGKKRDAILERLRHAERKIGDSLPFAAQSFARTMEATVEKAKIEVGAYVQSVITRAGLAALNGETAILQLGTGERADG